MKYTLLILSLISTSQAASWTGNHNRHEGQFCSDDSDCVVPLRCYQPPTLSGADNSVVSALAPRLSGVFQAGMQSLLSGKVCRKLEGNAAKAITDYKAVETKHTEQAPFVSHNLFLENVINGANRAEEDVPTEIRCKNTQLQTAVGSSLTVSTAGASNDLFESNDFAALSVIEIRQQRKVR